MKPSLFSSVAETLLASGICVRFRASGTSMGQAVRDGEVVTVAPIHPHDVAVGDIVLCETRRGACAHRVQRLDRGPSGHRHLILRGDASLEDDRPVAPAAVRGRLVRVERAGRMVDLAIAGGALGRRLYVAALRARCELVVLTRTMLTGRFAAPR